jgi:hypothetical protein
MVPSTTGGWKVAKTLDDGTIFGKKDDYDSER